MRRIAGLITILSSLLLATPCVASDDDEKPSLNQLEGHSHDAIVVRSKPVIERLALKVIEPVDLKLSSAGQVFVADRKAECVFRLDSDGSVSLPVERLPNIQRIQVDRDGSLFVLASSDGECELYQITSNGQRVLLGAFPFPSDCFARDDVGLFVLGVRKQGRLVSFSPDGTVSELVRLPSEAMDVTFNAGGQLEALTASGHIIQVNDAGAATVSGFAPVGARRLTSLSDGSVLALYSMPGAKAQVVFVCREADRPAEFQVAASVPVGTRAVGFDSLGNLCLANPDLRAVTKVTSHFEVPCPHCGKLVPMVLNPDGPEANKENGANGGESRTF
ncbi:MAG: hypothetical protein ACK58L_16465 [Planctomycetota bacterium]